jgi:hypothetical protein
MMMLVLLVFFLLMFVFFLRWMGTWLENIMGWNIAVLHMVIFGWACLSNASELTLDQCMEVLEDISQLCWGMAWGVVSQWLHVYMSVLIIITVSAPALTVVPDLLLMFEDFFFHLLEFSLLVLNMFNDPFVMLEFLAH